MSCHSGSRNRESPMNRWRTSLKVPALMVLMLSYAFARNTIMILPVLLSAVMLFILSRLPVPMLLPRLRVPISFLAVMTLLLAFFSGHTSLLTIGPIVLRQEGLLLAAMIWARVISIMIVSIVLIHTTPSAGLPRELNRLGIPRILTDMAVLTGRYISVLGDDYRLMRTAMRLRGYRKRGLSINGLVTLASLTGTLLIRGFEQSERVFRAMRLRGYGTSVSSQDNRTIKISRFDILLTVVVISASVLIVSAELLLRGA